MNFGQSVGEIGDAILDTTTDLISGFGTNFKASADANAAYVRVIDTNVDLAVKKQADQREMRLRQQKMLEVALYTVLGASLITLVIVLLKKYS